MAAFAVAGPRSTCQRSRSRLSEQDHIETGVFRAARGGMEPHCRAVQYRTCDGAGLGGLAAVVMRG